MTRNPWHAWWRTSPTTMRADISDSIDTVQTEDKQRGLAASCCKPFLSFGMAALSFAQFLIVDGGSESRDVRLLHIMVLL